MWICNSNVIILKIKCHTRARIFYYQTLKNIQKVNHSINNFISNVRAEAKYELLLRYLTPSNYVIITDCTQIVFIQERTTFRCDVIHEWAAPRVTVTSKHALSSSLCSQRSKLCVLWRHIRWHITAWCTSMDNKIGGVNSFRMTYARY